MNTEIVPQENPGLPEAQKWESRRVMRGPANQFDDAEMSFPQLLLIMRRRRSIIWTVAGSVFVLALLFTLLSTAKYRSTAIIEFNRQNADALGLDEERDTLGEAGSSDYSVTQQTQAKILQSETLALQVIQQLHLESRPEFAKRPLLDYLRSVPDESGLPLEQAPFRRMRILKAYRKNLKVDPVAGTRMINVEFLNPDPLVAATITNKLVADYKDQYFQKRFEATIASSGWLSKQLDQLKSDMEAAQQRLVDYQNQVGILGTDETHNIVMTRLEELNRQLMLSESNRILSETVVNLARSGNVELISGLASPSVSAASSMSKDSLSAIESLRAQKRQLDLQYAELSVKFGPSYPKLVELQNQRKEMEASLKDEGERLTARAENDFIASRNAEAALRASFEKEKEEANQLNDSAVHYTILKHEVESSRTLYDGLLKKLKEADLLAGMRSTNIVVVDPARPSDRPARPIVPLNLAVGLFGGLLLGVGSAFLVENIDDCINTADDAEEIAMVPSLGMIPLWKRHQEKLKSSKGTALTNAKQAGIMVVSQTNSQPAEAFRALRTSIIQSIRPGIPTVILVASATPGEGKTTVSLNCAAAFAQQGARVLLVEADLRRAKLAAHLNLTTTHGLTSLIRGEACPDLPVKLPSLPFLSVVPAGPQPTYPAEALGSERMKALIAEWRGEYDFIVFDTPPVLSVTDAVALAAYCDLVVLVAKSRVTKKQSLARARTLFLRTRPRVLGVVINGIDAGSADYANYYGYDTNSDPGAPYYAPVSK